MLSTRLPLASSVGIALLSSSVRVTIVPSTKPLLVSDGFQDQAIDRTPGVYLGPKKMEYKTKQKIPVISSSFEFFLFSIVFRCMPKLRYTTKVKNQI